MESASPRIATLMQRRKRGVSVELSSIHLRHRSRPSPSEKSERSGRRKERAPEEQSRSSRLDSLTFQPGNERRPPSLLFPFVEAQDSLLGVLHNPLTQRNRLLHCTAVEPKLLDHGSSLVEGEEVEIEGRRWGGMVGSCTMKGRGIRFSLGLRKITEEREAVERERRRAWTEEGRRTYQESPRCEGEVLLLRCSASFCGCCF